MPRKRTLAQSFTIPFGEISGTAALIAASIVWALVFGVWAIASYGGYVADMFLPVPDAVVRRAILLASDGTLFVHLWSSVKVVILGFLLSAVIAVPLGLYMGTYRIVQAALEPLVNFIRYLPVTSLVPLFILWIGIGLGQRVTVIFFGVFFSQLIMIADEAHAVSRDLVNASYTLGTKRGEAIWHVIFPAALPNIINTLRVTMGWAWTYLVVAELVAANSGLGFISLKAMRGFQVDIIFLAIFLIGLLGLISDMSFRLLRRWLCPWAA